MKTTLFWNAKRSICLCLPILGLKAYYHQAWLKETSFNFNYPSNTERLPGCFVCLFLFFFFLLGMEHRVSHGLGWCSDTECHPRLSRCPGSTAQTEVMLPMLFPRWPWLRDKTGAEMTVDKACRSLLRNSKWKRSSSFTRQNFRKTLDSSQSSEAWLALNSSCFWKVGKYSESSRNVPGKFAI